MVRQAPGTGVDVQALVELAVLGFAAQFGISVAAAQGPVAAARFRVVFEHLHLVAGLAQLQRSDKAGDAGA